MTFCAQGFRVAVNTATGEIRILQSVQAVDAGTVLNPVQLRGQVEGGVAQALGAALFEEVRVTTAGRVTTRALREYHVPVLADVPRTEVIFVPSFDPLGPLGAKPMSEAPFNPVAPALANAVRDATGVRVRSLPMRRDFLYETLKEASAGGTARAEPLRQGGGARRPRRARGRARRRGRHPGLERVHVAVRGPGRRQPARRQLRRAADRLAEEQGVRPGAGDGASGSQRRSALALASYFVSSQEPITRARIAIEEYGWSPIGATGYSFARSGDLVRTTVVTLDAALGASVVSGHPRPGGAEHDGVGILGVPEGRVHDAARDEGPHPRDGGERTVAVPARGGGCPGRRLGAAHACAKAALLAAFAGTYSYSLQQTLYAMGFAVLADVPSACEVRLALPNKHHYLVDFAPFGLANDREVYNAGDRPYGLIEGNVLADDAPDAGIGLDLICPATCYRTRVPLHQAICIVPGIPSAIAYRLSNRTGNY